jgi:hypothetical protein
MASIRLSDGTIVLGTIEELSAILSRSGLQVTDPEPVKLESGDYAKVVKDSDIETGAIVRIDTIDYEDKEYYYFVDTICEPYNSSWVAFDALVPATEGDITWANIGRRVGEFKVGDIVRGIGRVGEKTGREFIGVVEDTDELNGCMGNLGIQIGDNGYASIDVTELLVPVESVVNLTYDKKGE